MNNSLLLLKTLLLSTSQSNIFKYTTDPKKKKKVIASYIGLFFLYAMFIGYSISICIGFGQYGLIGVVPSMCALTISILALVFTFFKTNGYLFNFKEYDMLMSLPFEAKTVAGCKFLYMYIKSLGWYLSISVAMLIGYGIYAKPAIYVYPLWMVLSLFIPLIPMLIATFFGFLIARISAGFKKNNLVQTVLTFVFILICFSSRYIIEYLIRENKMKASLESAGEIFDQSAKYYLPAGWFAGAILETKISDILLLVGVSVVLFAIVFLIIGNSYRNINSALKNHAASRKYKMSTQKKKSVVQAIAFKEAKRMFGSTTYMVNVGMGEVLAPIFALVCLIFGFDKVVKTITGNAPFDSAILQPALPFVIYFFIGMMSTTACSMSLEGKQYWIVQSLPIEKKTLYLGKMLFNLYLTVPIALISTVLLCLSAKVPVVNMVLYLLLEVVLCVFSTCWGSVCGIKNMRLDWENEIEVIKQGMGTFLYLVPNMFFTMIVLAGSFFLGLVVDHRLLTLGFILLYSILSLVCYLWVMKMAKK